MSNPVPPPTPNYSSPPPSGGMPKWLIILLAVFLVFILGCCGFWAACNFMCARVGNAVQAQSAALQVAAQQAIVAEQQRLAAEAAARGGAPLPPEVVAGGGAGGEAAGASAGGGGAGAPVVPIARIPANFPKDIPVMAGMTPMAALADNASGAGWVQFSAPGKLQDTVDYFEKQMASQGWKLGTNMDTGNASIRSFTKDTREVTMNFTTEEKMTMALIAYQQKN